MSEKRTPYVCYGPRNLFWLMDHYNDIHIRFSAELDHEIDEELMQRAWERTVRVYPVIGCVIEMEGKELFFYPAEGENRAVRSKAPINPGSAEVSGCVVTATYYGRRITVSAYHTMVDGGGLNEIFKTLLYFYLSSRTGTCDGPEGVQTAENRPPEAYYHPVRPDDLGTFTQVPLHTMPYLRDYAEDPDMEADAEGNRWFGSVRFSVEQFIGKCREIGANPTAMLSLLTAKAFYTLHPEERKDLFFEVTTSVRKTFGAEGCISNCVCNVIAGAEYADVMEGDARDYVRKIRAEIDSQRTDDYIKSWKLFDSTYGHNYVHKQITLSYIGRLDIGENTKHISNFEMGTNAVQLVLLMQLETDFLLMLQMGKATARYLERMSALLNEMGVETRKAAEPRTVVTDSDTPVL